jgi:hypothetical protein
LLLALLAAPLPLWAKGCFPQVYYDLLLRPLPQEASSGDPRLVGLSDYLASKGKDPHAKEGSGCMCGVNHGRWDQIFLNASPRDPARAPVSFRLQTLALEFFDRHGKPQGCRFQLDAKRLPECLDAAMKTRGFRPYYAEGGHSDAPDLLEPGENVLGCLCLPREQRHKSGYVLLSLHYQPLVFFTSLPGSRAKVRRQAGFLVLHEDRIISRLAPGQGAYFHFHLPSPLVVRRGVIELGDARHLALYTSLRWQPSLAQWRRGRRELEDLSPAELLILVRATGPQAQGKLHLHLQLSTSSGQLPHLSLRAADRVVARAVAPPGQRVFKAYVLGLGSPRAEAQDSAPARPCCSR